MSLALPRMLAGLLVLGILAAPLAARADLYVNPKDGYFYAHISGIGCHPWGSSVRCDSSDRIHFYRPRYGENECKIHVDMENHITYQRWHASVTSGPCKVHWHNNNTLEVLKK
jgi:hypothetical protein